jgi:large subunit ribosomal protein L15
MNLKKRRKSSRMHGKGQGTHGWGARKKHLGSGHRGGCGNAGSGKRADHQKMHYIKEYDNKYFGKQGFTSRATKKKKNPVLNLKDLIKNLESIKKKYENKQGIINLEKYKLLGDEEIKVKISIKVKAASEKAKKRIEEAGGNVVIDNKKEKASSNQ